MKYFLCFILAVILVGCSARETRKIYYDNGELKSIFQFKGDKKDGIQKSYDESGKLVQACSSSAPLGESASLAGIGI